MKNNSENFTSVFQLVLTKIDLATHHIILKNLFELKKERSSWMLGALPQPFLIRHVALGLFACMQHVTYIYMIKLVMLLQGSGRGLVVRVLDSRVVGSIPTPGMVCL